MTPEETHDAYVRNVTAAADRLRVEAVRIGTAMGASLADMAHFTVTTAAEFYSVQIAMTAARSGKDLGDLEMPALEVFRQALIGCRARAAQIAAERLAAEKPKEEALAAAIEHERRYLEDPEYRKRHDAFVARWERVFRGTP